MTTKAIQDCYPDNFSHCHGCGRLNPHGLQLKSYFKDNVCTASFTPAPHHISMPGFVYGGLMASLVDCHGTATAAGAAAKALGLDLEKDPAPRFVTAALHVDFIKPTPLGVPLSLTGTIKEEHGRKVVVLIELMAENLLRARGEMVLVPVPETMQV